MLPRLEHHFGIVNGVSKENYGGNNDLLGGSGQGNMFSGSDCRDSSCFASRKLEDKRLEVMLKVADNKHQDQCAAVAFVDDTDFCTYSGEIQ